MKQIIRFLEKVFFSRKSETYLPYDLVAHYLAKVAKSHTYVETFSKHADTLHKWIKDVYEEDIMHSFERQVRTALQRMDIRSAGLAFDITHEAFYGKTRNLHLFNVSSEPYGAEFRYITCCLVNDGMQIPLMALPVRHGEQVRLCIDLIKYCLSLKIRIKFALFDRGFYSGELIDFLESRSVRYLMLIPAIKGRLQEYRTMTPEFGKYEHQVLYSKKKSKWKPMTTIVVCKKIADFDWMFATNIQFTRAIDYVLLYKRRWQIETNYRVEDEASIRSKSSDYMIRYFYFVVSNVFHLLWITHKNSICYVQFKRYLDIIETELLYDFLDLKGI